MATLSQIQVDTLSAITIGGTANFWEGYTYVESILKNDSSASDLLFWLGKASEINSDSYDSLGNTFIREVSRSGLIYSGFPATDADLQRNSDLIGAAVINDLLQHKVTPTVPSLIAKDVNTAVVGGGESVGGWGGAFYYWNVMFDTNNTVGQLIQGTPVEDGRFISVEYDKFITANAKATYEVMTKFGLSLQDAVAEIWTGATAQAPLAVKLEIMGRITDWLNGTVKSWAGDPNSIEGNYPAYASDGKTIIGWKYDTSTETGISVTDPALITTLNTIHDTRTRLAADPNFLRSNPDQGLHNDGAIAAMTADSNTLVAISSNMPNSFIASTAAEKDLAKLATWYADRLATIEQQGGKPGVLDLQPAALTPLQIDMTRDISSASNFIGKNSKGKETQLTDDQKLAPRLDVFDMLSHALAPASDPSKDMSQTLNAAIQSVWVGAADPTTFAAKKIDYYLFEAANGSAVELHADDSMSSALVGGNGADTLSGGDLDDIIIGRDGNNTIDGGAGNDIIFGGKDNDTITGGGGNDYIDSGAGKDTINAAAAADGGGDSGNDIIFAGSEDDTVYLGVGSDVVSLGDGNDEIHLSASDGGNGGPVARSIIWGGDGSDSFYFQGQTHVLSIHVDGMSDDLLKNLSTSGFFSAINKGLEWPYDYVLVNVDSSDKIFVDGTQLSTAVATQAPGSDDTGFNFDYTFSHINPADGVPYYDAHSMTRNQLTYEDDYYQMPGFDGPYGSTLQTGDYGLSISANQFALDGFADGVAGIHFTGDGIAAHLETTTTVQQIDVSSIDHIQYNWDGTADEVPMQYTNVGDAVVTHQVLDEGYHIRPDGYDSYTAPTIDLAAYEIQSVSGTDGDDQMTASDAQERFNGGDGSDTVDYSASTSSITIDLSAGTGQGGAAGDTFASIENLNGTAFDDELDGSTVANILSGNDGDDWLEGYGGDDTLKGGAGDDGLIGDDGNDTLLGGDGDDWFDGGAGNDTMNGGAGDFDEADYYGNLQDYSFTRNADNSVTVVSEKDGSDTLIDVEQIWLYSEDGSSYQIYDLADLAPVQPDNPGQNTITGTSGDDDLTGTSGNDTFDGGLGNDSLNGGDGSDTYLYHLGDGSDGIGDQSASTTDVDTLKFVDINFADVTFSPSANDVLATINPTGDVVSIYWQFLDASAGWGLEKILFADGISMDLKHGDVVWQINGTDGNDQITSPMWGSAEIFDGGKGNDFLDGTAGSDTYLYAFGDGSDEIDDDVGFLDDGNVDVLKLTDLSSSDIALSRDGDNLKVTITGTGDVITIDDQFTDPDAGFGIEEIDFADGSSISRADILASLGGGGGDPGNGGGGDPGNSGGQTITGTSGDDDLTGTSGNDTLDGGLGNDSVNGGDGSDTYLYRLGDGSDGIGDQSASTTDVDTLKFVDINFADVTFSPSANDVLATINPTGDVVSIYWQFLDASAGWGLEKILFADGISMDLKHGDVVWQINGTDGNDQIISPMWGSAEIFNGGKGNDFLDGTAGSDTYLYALGDGSDEIDDDVGFLDDGNVDVLKLTDLNSSNVTLARDGDNLKVTIAGTGDVITVDNQFLDPDAGFGIEEIDFADGSSIDRADIESATSSSSLTMARAASVMAAQPQALDHIDLRPIVLESASSSAQPTADWNGGAWGGSGDGVLAIDLGADGQAGGDGVLDQAREVSFSLWATAPSDGSPASNLDGLHQAFDSNGDGVLDANDARWSEFRVWHDANQNGVTDPGELESLSDAGIKLINLMPAAANQSFADGSAVSGAGSYDTTDGSRYLTVDTSQWAQTSAQRAA